MRREKVRGKDREGEEGREGLKDKQREREREIAERPQTNKSKRNPDILNILNIPGSFFS